MGLLQCRTTVIINHSVLIYLVLNLCYCWQFSDELHAEPSYLRRSFTQPSRMASNFRTYTEPVYGDPQLYMSTEEFRNMNRRRLY
jgi:hypothetical protein